MQKSQGSVVAFALSNPDSLTLTLSRVDNGYGVLQIVNWRTYLKFPAEARLSPEAKNLICRLLCDVEHRMRGADEIKVCHVALVKFLLELEAFL